MYSATSGSPGLGSSVANSGFGSNKGMRALPPNYDIIAKRFALKKLLELK